MKILMDELKVLLNRMRESRNGQLAPDEQHALEIATHISSLHERAAQENVSITQTDLGNFNAIQNPKNPFSASITQFKDLLGSVLIEHYKLTKRQ